jgi:Transcriptional regulator
MVTSRSISPDAGRRSLNKEDKRARIFAAARRLFAEFGYAAVTTQQVSDEAGIGAGTLFRYAGTKGELLLMVYNQEFADAFARAEKRVATASGTEDAVWALVEAILEPMASHPHNTAMYQRELLFGGAEEGYRDEGLAQVDKWQQAVARELARELPAAHDDERVVAAARSAFAVVSLVVSAVREPAVSVAQLRTQMTQIISGLRAQTAADLKGNNTGK